MSSSPKILWDLLTNLKKRKTPNCGKCLWKVETLVTNKKPRSNSQLCTKDARRATVHIQGLPSNLCKCCNCKECGLETGAVGTTGGARSTTKWNDAYMEIGPLVAIGRNDWMRSTITANCEGLLEHPSTEGKCDICVAGDAIVIAEVSSAAHVSNGVVRILLLTLYYSHNAPVPRWLPLLATLLVVIPLSWNGKADGAMLAIGCRCRCPQIPCCARSFIFISLHLREGKDRVIEHSVDPFRWPSRHYSFHLSNLATHANYSFRRHALEASMKSAWSFFSLGSHNR